MRGNVTQAEAIFKSAFRINPRNDRALAALASLYESQGKLELAREYGEKLRASRLEDVNPVTKRNFYRLKEILDRRGIKLVCAQYPMRSLEPLRKIFGKYKDVVFVDNEAVFQTAVKKEGYPTYFRDMFAGDFGHCTPKGNELLAQNIADVILEKVFAVPRTARQTRDLKNDAVL
ncbi:MAG: tetratricopeptide repeat protein [Candidatus Omnitrophota bacterium]